MKAEIRVTAAQVMIAMYLSVVASGSAFLFEDSGVGFEERILAVPLTLLLGFAFIMPLWLLVRKKRDADIIDFARIGWGKFGGVVAVVYALYFLYAATMTLSGTEKFVTDVIMPNTPSIVVSVLIMVFCLFSAFFGIEGILRATVVVAAVVVTGIVFIAVSQTYMYEPLAFRTFFELDLKDVLKDSATNLSSSFEPAALALIIPLTLGSRKKGYSLFLVLAAVTGIILLTVVILMLGAFATTQPYPFYAVTQASRAGVFERMDVFYSAVWIAACFMKITLYLYLFGHCLKKILPRKVVRVLMFVAAAAAAGTEGFIESLGKELPFVPIGVFLFVSAGIPLLILPFAGKKMKEEQSC